MINRRKKGDVFGVIRGVRGVRGQGADFWDLPI